MIPGNYITFFTTMATTGAALFGLIFVAISIRSDLTHAEQVPILRQVQVASAYSALLNPLVISLFALLPDETIDTITLIMSIIGLVNTIIIGISLFTDTRGPKKLWNTLFFILVSLVMYGFEIFYAIDLSRAPGDTSVLKNLSIVLVIIYLYGIARAWDLVGVRQFHIQELLKPLISNEQEEISADKKKV